MGRGHYDFVKSLIHPSDVTTNGKKININQRTIETGETPIFFALGKLKKNPSEKIRMVKLLLESEDIDLSILNHDNKAAYEAYNDQFGFDEASSLVEKQYLNGAKGGDTTESRLLFRDLSVKDKELLADKKVSAHGKSKIVETHIFERNGGDLMYDQEIREQLKQA